MATRPGRGVTSRPQREIERWMKAEAKRAAKLERRQAKRQPSTEEILAAVEMLKKNRIPGCSPEVFEAAQAYLSRQQEPL